MISGEERMARARIIVLRDAPYIASILFGLVPYPTNEVETMITTEHMVLMFNPEWVATLTDEEAAGVLFHECNHVLRGHFDRFGEILIGEEKALAGSAIDIAINPDLLRAGWKLTRDAYVPAMFGLPEGKSAEWYFIELRKQNQKTKGKGKGKGGSGDGDDKEGGSSGKKQGVCSGNCGGITGNKHEHSDKESRADAECGRSDIEQYQMVKSSAEAIKEHAAQGRGRVPAGLLEIANRLDEPPKVDWRSTLARVVRTATGKIRSGGKDFSLRRPSKRSFLRDMMRPSIVQYTPELAIIRDTSGSMGKEQIDDATNESIGLVRAAAVDHFWFIDADARVAFAKRIGVRELFDLPVHGRGGTDFRPAIELVQKLKPRPNVTIYVTDGDGCAPPHPPPDMEFIWCVVPSYYKRRPADWGHLVVVSETEITLGPPL